jgi:hypothetical protein
MSAYVSQVTHSLQVFPENCVAFQASRMRGTGTVHLILVDLKPTLFTYPQLQTLN